MIQDAALESALRSFAAELAEQADWPDGSAWTADVAEAVILPVEVKALTAARIHARLDGAKLRSLLFDEAIVSLGPDREVTDAVAGFFDIWARLLVAFARPLTKPAGGPRQVVIAERPKVKVRDTIFEQNIGQIGEKTGGLDLSPGQPTSTAEYAPQVPAFAPPLDPDTAQLRQRMAAMGYYQTDEAGDAADTLARLGGAPPAAAPVKVRVPYPDDGKERVGNVFIHRPGVLSANAPPVLRTAAADAGPQVPLVSSPPETEV